MSNQFRGVGLHHAHLAFGISDVDTRKGYPYKSRRSIFQETRKGNYGHLTRPFVGAPLAGAQRGSAESYHESTKDDWFRR
jgi:hypothetical protein